MYVIRNVMHCKPGMVKDLVKKFKEMDALMKKYSPGSKLRILTDVSGERYWTAIMEIDTESVEKHEAEMSKAFQDPAMKSIGDYHTFVESGYRQVFKVAE